MNADTLAASAVATAIVRNTLTFRPGSEAWICVVLVESSMCEAADFNRDFSELSSQPLRVTKSTMTDGKWKMTNGKSSVSLRAQADELIQTHSGAQYDPTDQKPRLRSQPPIQQPPQATKRDHRRKQRESRGIRKTTLPILVLVGCW